MNDLAKSVKHVMTVFLVFFIAMKWQVTQGL